MLATYHNHSNWSDGTTPITDMVDAARTMGIDALGMSDHLVLHPRGRPPSWSMAPERLGDYVADVLAHRAADAPTIRLGLEVDYFPGHEDAIRSTLDGIPFDYLIGAVHEVDGFPIDATAADWDALDVDARNHAHRTYWHYKRRLAESGLFDIIAHLDLPKKFGHRPTVDLTDEIDHTLDAIADAGLVVELNTAGWHKPCRDAYPTPEILRRCRERGIPVTLSADAHAPDHLLRDFDRGAQRLRDAGYDRIARFAERQITYTHLPSGGAGGG